MLGEAKGLNRGAVIVSCFFCVLSASRNAQAFGLGDIISSGVQVGSKMVSAGVDKVKDSMRDPEAEAAKKQEEQRKLAEQYQKTIDQVEARSDLTPLQRERLIITLKQQYEKAGQLREFIESTEAQQRAERSKIFTPDGFASAVGQSVAGSSRVAIAQADAMAHSPIYRAQIRSQDESVMRQADAMVAAGTPQSKIKSVIDQADAAKRADTQEQVGATPPVAQQLAGVSPSNSDNVVKNSAPTGRAPEVDAFTPDLGKKLWVEFAKSQTETQKLRKYLASKGHVMANSVSEADISYLVDGEYIIAPTKQYDGLRKDAGDLIENPSLTIAPPEKKLMGSFNLGVAKLLLGAATVQGQQVPEAMVPKEQTTFKQEVLLVIARQPKGGKETRVSILKEDDQQDIVGIQLASAARDDLYVLLGMSGSR